MTYYGQPRQLGCIGANEQRRATAAQDMIDSARDALRHLNRLTPWEIIVLQTRIDYPDATLAQLGEQVGVTKYAYVGRFRRAVQHAHQPPPRRKRKTSKKPRRIRDGAET